MACSTWRPRLSDADVYSDGIPDSVGVKVQCAVLRLRLEEEADHGLCRRQAEGQGGGGGQRLLPVALGQGDLEVNHRGQSGVCLNGAGRRTEG